MGLAAFVAGSRLKHPSQLPRLQAVAPAVKQVTPITGPSRQSIVSPVHSRANAQTPPSKPGLRIPLEFEANRGQAAEQFDFVAHGPTYSLGLSASEIALSLHHPVNSPSKRLVSSLDGSAGAETQVSQLHLRLLGTSEAASVTGMEPKPGVSNYFIGNDPAKWRTNVPHFGTVQIANAYPGIDLVFYGNPQQLEYDFRVAPGADPGAIRVGTDGATSAKLDATGNLILDTAAGAVELKHPDAYQEIDGVRRPVKSDFRLVAGNSVQFRVGEYDRSKRLIIDPVLLYAVSIGGSNGNQAVAIDVDSAGNSYVTGNTCSTDFPSTAGNFQTIHSNPNLQKCYDAFVLKLDPTASTLLYSDYIGGSSTQSGSGIAVDSTGAAYVTGLTTTSVNFPLVNNIGPNAPVSCNFSSSGYSCPDAFVLKLSADGSTLLFSSLMGGSQAAAGFGVKLDAVTGDLLVVGSTNSSNFAPAPTTLETAFAGSSCASGIPCFVSFLLGLDPATGAYRYGTYFSGAGSTFLTGLSVDGTGDIYVTGNATPPLSTSLGTVTNTYAPSGGATAGGADIVVARLHPAGSALSTAYLTLIQGEADDAAAGIAVDGLQNAYITGSSASLNLPVTSAAFQSSTMAKSSYNCGWLGPFNLIAPKDCGTGFVGKLNATGGLSFLTYLGGSTGQDVSEAIGVDSLGNIWLTGVTGSSDFPFSPDAYSSFGAFQTPFLAEMSSNGSTLPFATPIASYLGESTGLKIDASNNVYVTGFASSVPSTPNVYPADPSAYNPSFIQKWGAGPQPVLQLSATSLTFPSIAYGGTSSPQTVTLMNTGTGNLELGIQLGLSTGNPAPLAFLESNNCGTSLAAARVLHYYRDL